MSNGCCKDCAARTLGCRAECRLWAEHELRKAARYEANARRCAQNADISESILRHRRARGTHGRMKAAR